MTTRWFTLLVLIGFLTLSGCQYLEENGSNPLSVIRWVNSLIKQEPKSKPSPPGVTKKGNWKSELSKPSREPGL